MKKEFRLILNLTKYPKCGIITSAFANRIGSLYRRPVKGLGRKLYESTDFETALWCIW